MYLSTSTITLDFLQKVKVLRKMYFNKYFLNTKYTCPTPAYICDFGTTLPGVNR